MNLKEANAWYVRNKDRLGLEDPVSDMIKRLGIEPKSALEIGCANGWRLEKLRQMYGCKVLGIEMSVKAVRSGRKQFPEVKFWNTAFPLWATALSSLALSPEFDLIICGFFLYLADRRNLFSIADQIDLCLADGGILIIHDFYSERPYSNSYEHDKTLCCYKMDYSRLFTGNPAYQILDKSMTGSEESDDAVAVIALRKDAGAGWPKR